MNDAIDSFEWIAADAVDLLLAIVTDLAASDDVENQIAAALIAATTENFCHRAIALGGV